MNKPNTDRLKTDRTPIFELSDNDIQGHHELCDLATGYGHATLTSCLNEWNMWGSSVGELAELLTK